MFIGIEYVIENINLRFALGCVSRYKFAVKNCVGVKPLFRRFKRFEKSLYGLKKTGS